METSTIGTLLPSQKTTEASVKLADNFDDFLMLLTTQLQHQDPLDPLDSNDFTSQLVQFSGVEQAIAQNARLDTLIAVMKGSQVADAVSFIGKTVEVVGDAVALKDGSVAQINYTLTSPANATTIVVSDSTGKVIRTVAGDNTVGAHQFEWDGADNNGNAQPEGIYTIKVSAADSKGETFTLNTTVPGVVDGVSNEDGVIVLSINGVTYPLKDVISVKKTSLPSVPSA